jgi:hypothetical protein
MPDPFDEEADVRSHLASLGRAALPWLERVLEKRDNTPIEQRSSRRLTARPAYADLATLIAMADEVVRLRLLRAIRDLGDA